MLRRVNFHACRPHARKGVRVENFSRKHREPFRVSIAIESVPIPFPPPARFHSRAGWRSEKRARSEAFPHSRIPINGIVDLHATNGNGSRGLFFGLFTCNADKNHW